MKPITLSALVIAHFLVTTSFAQSSGSWKPAADHVMTRWAEKVSPEDAWREYPRPQMVRKEWTNLNGLWQYAICDRGGERPADWDGEILVPFCIESALSGVGREVGPEKEVWYRRTFAAPKLDGGRLLLHFGAVDWRARAWVNGQPVGEHVGGYDPFTLDVTEALTEGEQELVVCVWDPTDAGFQPRGKQVQKPHGIWYTAVTGIWQTVWLERTPAAYVKGLRIVPDVDNKMVTVLVKASAAGKVKLTASAAGKQVADAIGTANEPIILKLAEPKLWSPDKPFLYDLRVAYKTGRSRDEVRSYFGMRKIAISKDEAGINRLFLNNKPLFQYGPLDQGWWPDGLYTAPTDEALRYDIEITKQLGFNMIRKHVKVEPARWYYWCDKLGVLVWQDMPSGDKYIHGSMPDIERSPESAAGFERELQAMVEAFGNHPSIVMWVPFNEGWGQWDTERVCKLIKSWDATRLVNNASGWTDRGVGDVHDMHSYPGPGMPALEEKRAVVLGEFGGLGLPLKGHTWQDEKNWGYRSYESQEALTEAYVALLRNLHILIGRGLSAAVYTQTTDVEVEVNGLMTYDRAVIKVDAAQATAAARKLYGPPPTITAVLPTSESAARQWHYTTTAPEGEWFAEDYDASAWQAGDGGFGTTGTPGAIVKTTWDGADIWIRQTFELDKFSKDDLSLLIHHDEDAEVYINGVRAAKLKGYTTAYKFVPINGDARNALRSGKNVIAIHCHQTGGGQYIDAGLVEIR